MATVGRIMSQDEKTCWKAYKAAVLQWVAEGEQFWRDVVVAAVALKAFGHELPECGVSDE